MGDTNLCCSYLGQDQAKGGGILGPRRYLRLASLCMSAPIAAAQRRWRWALTDTICEQLIGIVQVATTCSAVSHGYGTRWSELTEQTRSSVEKLLYASQILYICALGCTRLSTCFFTTRLSRHRRHKILNYVWTAACLITIVTSVLVIAIRGDIAQPWATLDGSETLVCQYITHISIN